MTQGSPDNQHELMVTGLARCLRQAFPRANFTFGTVVSDLGLKPDIFVSHPDGRRWAYEMVNKNAAADEIKSKHQKYLAAGVSAYWILWENLAPAKPLDADKVISQAIWVDEALLEEPRQYWLNKLQRTLAELGGGCLYVFAIYKPLLDLVEHWALKLIVIGLDIYKLQPQPHPGKVTADIDFVPLPYLVFGEQGQPQLRPDADEISPYLSSVMDPRIQFPSDGPVFIKESFGNLDSLFGSPEEMQQLMQQALIQALSQSVADYSPADLAQLGEELQSYKERMPATSTTTDFEKPEQLLTALVEYLDSLPPIIQEAFRVVFDFPNKETIGQLIELKQWYEEDPYLQELLADM